MEKHWSAAEQRMGSLCLPQVLCRLGHFRTISRLFLLRPEPHILLFRRPLGTDPVSGEVRPELEREARELYQQQIAMNVRK